MNVKMKEELKSIWENLTDEQKEKWKACKSEEEFMAFISEEGINLPEDMMKLSSDGEITDADAELAAGGRRPIYSQEEYDEWYRDPAAYDRG